MERLDHAATDGNRQAGMIFPLGRAISELLAPVAIHSRNPSKTMKKMKKRFQIAKMQVLLRRQRKDSSHKNRAHSVEGNHSPEAHDPRHAPIVNALLTVDEFLSRLSRSVDGCCAGAKQLSIDHKKESSKNSRAAKTQLDSENEPVLKMSLIMTPLREAFFLEQTASVVQKKETRRMVARFFEWLLCHPEGAILCHMYFELVFREGSDRNLKMQILEIFQDQLRRGLFCKIRDRIVASSSKPISASTSVSHGNMLTTGVSVKLRQQQSMRVPKLGQSKLVTITDNEQEASEAEMGISKFSDSSKSFSKKSSLDAVAYSLRGMVWCAMYDDAGTYPGAPTRLKLASLDCAIRLSYQILVVMKNKTRSQTSQVYDHIVHFPYWREKMMETKNESLETSPTEGVSEIDAQQGKIGKVWLWSVRFLIQDVVKILLSWVKGPKKMPSVGKKSNVQLGVARVANKAAPLLQMALSSCLEELIYWSSYEAAETENGNGENSASFDQDIYAETKSMADVARILEERSGVDGLRSTNSGSESEKDKSADALAWHFRIYAPFFINRTQLVRMHSNHDVDKAEGELGEKFSLFRVLLGEFEGWFRQCSIPSVDPSIASVALRCLALQMGRCQAAATAEAGGNALVGAKVVRMAIGKNLGMSGCLQGLILQLSHRAETSQQLALSLARNLLFDGTSSTTSRKVASNLKSSQSSNNDDDSLIDLDALFSSLLTMIDQHGDAISRAAVCLIADVAVQKPKHVLPLLFARLEQARSQIESDEGSEPTEGPRKLVVDVAAEDHSDENSRNQIKVHLARRQNTLAIIEEMFRINNELLNYHDSAINDETASEFSDHTGYARPLDGDLTDLLVSHMLSRLQDSELVLRTQASSLFARLQPARVVPRLCKMICSRDAKERSAAEQSLSEVMASAYNRDPCKTFTTLIDCLRHHETDTNKESKKKAHKIGYENAVDRVIRLAPRWVDALKSRTLQSRIFLSILRKMSAAPSDLILVKLMSKMAQAKATKESPEVFETIIHSVVKRMEKQTGLNKEMLFQQKDNQEVIQSLLFVRTSPLLMLRALPVTAFDIYKSSDTNDGSAYGDVFQDENYSDSDSDSDSLYENESGSDANSESHGASQNNTISVNQTNKALIRLRQSVSRLARELVKRSTQLYEFDQVRKLSAEIISRLPLADFVLPFIVAHLQYFMKHGVTDGAVISQFSKGSSTQVFLQTLFQSAGPDVTVVKATVYCACNTIILRCTQPLSFETDEKTCSEISKSSQRHLGMIFSRITPWIMLILKIPLSHARSPEGEISVLEKLQRGCIDCLACMCKAEALSREIMTGKHGMEAGTLIQEVTNSEDHVVNTLGHEGASEDIEIRPLSLIIDLFCGSIGLADAISNGFHFDAALESSSIGGSTPVSFRICMGNVLISLIRMWRPFNRPESPDLGDADSSNIDRKRQAMIVAVIREILCFADQKNINAVLRSAALQIVFISIHEMQGDLSKSGIPFGRIHALAISASQDAADSELRIGGLKLLAILIGKVKGIFTKVLAGAAGHTKSVVGQLANIDSSENVRSLAEKILTSAF